MIRESILDPSIRDEDILYKIAITGSRSHASLAAPGNGLALAGVGYDLEVLTQYKHRPAGMQGFEEQAEDQEDADEMEGGEGVSEFGETALTTHIITTQPSATAATTGISTSAKRPQSIKPSSKKKPRTANATHTQFLTAAHLLQTFTPTGHDLIAVHDQLLHMPQRLFSFSFGEILLANNFHIVSQTIWDAEVLLAHFLDTLPVAGNVLELGAGTGLAGMVCVKCAGHCAGRVLKNAEMAGNGEFSENAEIGESAPKRVKVCLQELDEDILTHTQEGCKANDVELVCVAGKWGKEFVHTVRTVCKLGSFDLIVLADVLYHTEHFTDLLQTLYHLSSPWTVIVLVYEQRRKKLGDFVQNLCKVFGNHQERVLTFRQQEQAREEECCGGDQDGSGEQEQAGVKEGKDCSDESDARARGARRTMFSMHLFSGKMEGLKHMK